MCSALPETDQRPGGEKGIHVAYTVRTKTFAYFTQDHHGDGRLAFTLRLLSASKSRWCPPRLTGSSYLPISAIAVGSAAGSTCREWTPKRSRN
jgi:hypothetical protein